MAARMTVDHLGLFVLTYDGRDRRHHYPTDYFHRHVGTLRLLKPLIALSYVVPLFLNSLAIEG